MPKVLDLLGESLCGFPLFFIIRNQQHKNGHKYTKILEIIDQKEKNLFISVVSDSFFDHKQHDEHEILTYRTITRLPFIQS